MKTKNSFSIKFIETNLILNALMAIKELKFVKTEVIIYDIRDYEKYELFHFCNSQHYDIGTWTDNYISDFEKVIKFKYVFIVGDDGIFKNSDFDNFIESIGKSHLMPNGLYFYNLNRKTIEDENLNCLLVENLAKTKLNYYPSLIVENEALWWGGIFIANDKIEEEFAKQLCISDGLYIGDLDKYSDVKKRLKFVSNSFSTQAAHDKTYEVWESALKLMKKEYNKDSNFWLSVQTPTT